MMSESDYSTISEHTTTDTSIYSSNEENPSPYYDHSLETSETDSAEEGGEQNSVEYHFTSYIESGSSIEEMDINSTDPSFNVETMRSPVEASRGSFNVGSDAEMESDVTNYSLDLPRSVARCSPIDNIEENVRLHSPQEWISHQRRWSLEECSICCEVMLNDQQLQTLACSHHFHAACVRLWLEEHQTCPNCRKKA